MTIPTIVELLTGDIVVAHCSVARIRVAVVRHKLMPIDELNRLLDNRKGILDFPESVVLWKKIYTYTLWK